MAVTIKDIAKAAGVGAGTVSRVLNGEKSVKERTREQVLKAIRELNYTPNLMAKRLRKNENGIIALLVPIINHPFFAKLAYYVEDEAEKFDYSVILVSSQERVDKETVILDRIKRREIDGAVFVTHYAHKEKKLEEYPIVSIDRPFGNGTPYVTSDNYDATTKAIEYLISKGCKKIGYVGSKPLVRSEVMEREKAYRDVMKKYGYEECVINEVISHGQEISAVKDFLERYDDLDGVFVSGDVMAQVLYETAIARGKKIPDDLQIVSYDGAFQQWNNNRWITCVEQPIEEMAREVVRLLISRMRNKEVPMRTVLNTSFVIGTTTK